METIETFESMSAEQVEAVYTEDSDICSPCCFNRTCPKEGMCLCDIYREENNIYDVEGDFYFKIKN